MKRRELFAAVPAAMALAAAAPQKDPKKAATAAAVKSFDDMQKDRHMVALMLYMSYRNDDTYPNIDVIKGTPYDNRPAILKNVLKEAYIKAQTLLNAGADSPAGAIMAHQRSMKSVSAVTDYPKNECPYGSTIAIAVAALLT